MTLRFDVVFEGESYRVEVGEDLRVRIEGEEFAPRVETQDGGYRVSLGRSLYRFRLDGRSLFLNGTPLDVAFRGYLPSSARARRSVSEGTRQGNHSQPHPGS